MSDYPVSRKQFLIYIYVYIYIFYHLYKSSKLYLMTQMVGQRDPFSSHSTTHYSVSRHLFPHLVLQRINSPNGHPKNEFPNSSPCCSNDAHTHNDASFYVQKNIIHVSSLLKSLSIFSVSDICAHQSTAFQHFNKLQYYYIIQILLRKKI